MKMDFDTKYNEFILSISYGNFLGSTDGTDKVILAHKGMLESAGISHVHIFPRSIRLPLTNKVFTKYWGVTIDGRTLKQVYTHNEVIQILGQVTMNKKNLKEVHVHHLLHVNMEQLEKILNVFVAPIKFYLHDYYTICLQYNLLKDNGVYCGKGAVSQKKCAGCKYYLKSREHYAKIKKILNKYGNRMHFIAPSKVTKEIWSSVYPEYEASTTVIYHQSLVGRYYENCEIIPDEEPIKIAYVGDQGINKGWQQWENAIRKAYELGCNEKYYHFGRTNDKIRYVEKIPVFFTSDNINAMVEALRADNIDVVVLWSICPETYSYTYYESTAANTFIITNKYSGNIAAMVLERNNGIVLDSEAELIELICDEKRLRKLVNEFKSSKNYGPLNLIENTELLQLITKEKDNNDFKIQISEDNLFSGLKRQMRILFFNLYQIARRLKRWLR